MGESSFWYRPTRVVPDQRPLNGRCWLLMVSLVNSRAAIKSQCHDLHDIGHVLRFLAIDVIFCYGRDYQRTV